MKQVANAVASEGQKTKRVPANVCKPTGAECACIEAHFGYLPARVVLGALERRGYVYLSSLKGVQPQISQKFIGCLNRGLERIRVSFRVQMNSELVYCVPVADYTPPMVH
ncbi:MAG: hypothetical protein ACYC1K_03215 [Minisyncoccota bacterium]